MVDGPEPVILSGAARRAAESKDLLLLVAGPECLVPFNADVAPMCAS